MPRLLVRVWMVLLAVVPAPALAQPSAAAVEAANWYAEHGSILPIPAADLDLEAIVAALQDAAALTSTCLGGGCEEMACSEASAYWQRIRDAEYVLSRLVYWLHRAGDSHMEAFRNFVAQGLLNQEQMARLHWAVGWNQFLLSFGQSMLSVASLSNGLMNRLESPELWSRTDLEATLSQFRTLLGATRTAGGLVERILTQQGALSAPGSPPAGDAAVLLRLGELLNASHSALGSVGTLLAELKALRDAGGSLSALLTADSSRLRNVRNARAAIGELIAGPLAEIAQLHLAERHVLVNQLEAELAGLDLAQSNAHRALVRSSSRRHLAEDALTAAGRLLWGSGTWTQFMFSRSCYVPSPLPSIQLPSWVSPAGLLQDPRLAGFGYDGQWGAQLAYLNLQLGDVAAWLADMPVFASATEPNEPAEPTAGEPGVSVLGVSSGRFVNPLPISATTSGVGSDRFTWGVPHGTNTVSNSLIFAGGRLDAAMESAFNIGVLEYYNGTTATGTDASSVELQISLQFNAPLSAAATLGFRLDMISTPNAGDLDPDADADIVALPTSFPVETFTFGGVLYTLELLGFRNVLGDGFLESDATRFHVREHATASAELWARVTARELPVIDLPLGEEPPPPALIVDWFYDPREYRGRDGEAFRFVCPPGEGGGSIWGTDVYTDDSSVCRAAVHAGFITGAAGGTVTIRMLPGQGSYAGVQRNGVASSNWGSWPGSYVFVGGAAAQD